MTPPLIVRGFCTLRPNVPGMSSNIRVTSMLGRFLEHSRIYYFRSGQTDPLEGDFYIGSADWMYRNLHGRVEAACPIDRKPLRARLWDILQIALNDRRQSWEMDREGVYTLRSIEGLDPIAPEALGIHQVLMNRALASSRLGDDTDAE
jgi:polyphosphate kinase